MLRTPWTGRWSLAVDRGLTLIELLIVIAVLGILAGMVIFALGGITAQSAGAACNSDAKKVQTAVAAYDTLTGYNGAGSTVPAPTATNLVPGYLHSFPSSSSYTITLNSTGRVLVQAPPSASPVLYATTNTCANGAPNGTTTTVAPTTTTVAPTTTTVAPTTTTVAPTTTTSPVPNGVTVTPSVPSNQNPNGAQEELSLTNTSAIKSMSIVITVAQTGGLIETQQTNSFPTGQVTQTNTTNGSAITYTWTLTKKIAARYKGGNTYSQFSDNGTNHPTSGDLWSVTTTSKGVTSTLAGHF